MLIAVLHLDDENAKLRLKINSKLGHKLNVAYQNSSNNRNGGEEKVEIRESFVAPEISMINFFLSDVSIKPFVKYLTQ